MYNHYPMLPVLPQLSLSLAGLDDRAIGVGAGSGGEVVRAQVAWAAARKLRAVQLDATAPGVRPRELDRSGRRDLAATLRRNELACSGLDFLIPAEHFTDATNVDRAVNGVLAAIDLASELAALSSGAVVSRFAPGLLAVSVQFPGQIAPDVLATIGSRAVERGVLIADHAFPVVERAQTIGVGIDPATVLGAGDDPTRLASTLGERIAAARLTDMTRGIGAQRVAPGSPGGRLDVLAYLVALATGPKLRFATLDLRGVRAQSDAVSTAIAAAAIA